MRQGRAGRGSRLRARAALTLAAWAALAAPSLAQGSGAVPPPPVRQAIDENGVDVIRGEFNAAQPSISIGPAYPHGLIYSSTNSGSGWFNGANSLIHQSGSTFLVSAAGASDSFTQSGSIFTPTEANGSSLVQSGATFTYTGRNGLVATFTWNSAGLPFWDSTVARATSLTFPDGTRIHFHHKIVQFCPGGEEGDPPEVPLTCPGGYKYALRLQSITNNHGYQLKFTYVSNVLDDRDPSTSYATWSSVGNIRAINNAVDYCAPAADSCAGFTQSWPTLSFIPGSSDLIVYNPAGEATRFTYSGDGITGIRRPGAASDNVVVTYSAGKVATTRIDNILHGYAYADSGAVRTTTVTAPDGGARVYTSDTATFRLTSFRDELNRTTSYEYDASGRPTKVTAPEGNQTRVTYDARGNVTETRAVAKPNTGLSDIVATAAYPASCGNPKTCNQPDSTTDPRGNTTDYAYDPTHGGVTSVTLPAPSAGAVRPQTRTAYAAFQAYYKDAGGAIAASAFPVHLPTAVSQCQTAASCAGTANEAKTTIAWGPQSVGTPNNLLPVSTSSGSGDGVLTATTAATYDGIGNLTALDGPLAGAGDTTTFRYDQARRRRGTISPDPDGGGALLRRAERLTWVNGLLGRVELGTANGTTDADWAAFAALQIVDVVHDADSRPIRRVLSGGGLMQAVTDTEYDDLGRHECSAVRMKPSAWATLTPGCTPQTGAGEIPDRIGRTVYDLAGQVTQLQTAVGTADQATEATSSYRANGRIESVTDGEGNKTTYEYDGHDRLAKTLFPSPTTDGVSSATDYEQPGYDAAGNVTSFRNRAGETIAFAYDALNRVTLKDPPNAVIWEYDVAYTYDNLGRLLTATDTNPVWSQQVAFAYDALGRKLSETLVRIGTGISHRYDLAGRRTRTTWSDGFFVDYDYQANGEGLHRIRENGATSGVGVLATFGYDDLGRRISLTRGNGTVTGYGYDAASRLSQLAQDMAGTTHDLTLGFTYNPAGQILSSSRSNDLYGWSGPVPGTTGSSVNGLNQLTLHAGSAVTHDSRGNLASDGTRTFSYTTENRLAIAGNVLLAFDPLGRFYLSNANDLWMIYDGDDLVAEWTTSGVNRRYVHGPGFDEPLVWYEGAGTSDRRFLHADERGSIVAVSDSAGTVTAINRYDEYGRGAATNAGRFQYTGQKLLSEAGVYDYKNRNFDPWLGRFLQPDPIGYAGGMNLYAYVGGDPVNFTDPSGLNGCGLADWDEPHVCGCARGFKMGLICVADFNLNSGGSGGGGPRAGNGSGRGWGGSMPPKNRNICDTPTGGRTPREAARQVRRETRRDVKRGALLGTLFLGSPLLGAAAGYGVSALRNGDRLAPGGSWDPRSSAEGNYLYGAVAVQGLGLPTGVAQWIGGVIEFTFPDSNNPYDPKNGNPFIPFDGGHGDRPESQRNIALGARCAP